MTTTRSLAHLLAVGKAYQQKYNKTLWDAIKAETSGDYKDILLALTKPRAQYWAERINGSRGIKGLGTKNGQLIRALVMNPKDKIQEIKQVYNQLYNRTVEQDVIIETSGDFKKALLALLDPN